MKNIVFNKLVRDKTPEILQNNGKKISIRLIEGEEYNNALDQKLLDEVTAYLESKNIEQLADITEVIRAILEYKNIDYTEFENIRLEKRKDRGAYKLKILLETVQE